ncbi:MAG TPA: sugar-binding protein [Kofleriaceae bacterium]|jgi:hypothetical protein|nr:sugar-binding protein [Kofleriaceae bacterium]
MRGLDACLIATVALAMACTKVPDVFVCTDDTQCRLDQVAGRCEPAGFCSVPAADCASEYRYDRSADEALAGQCVLEVDCSAPFAPTDAAAMGACVEGTPPVLDGDLSDWPAALFTTQLTHAGVVANGGVAAGTWTADEAANDAELSAVVAFRWDARNLYVAVNVTDDLLALEAARPVYDNDSFELFVDGADDRLGPWGNDDLQLLLRFDGDRSFARGGAPISQLNEVVTAVGESATGWTAEIAVPFAALGGTPAVPGRQLGIDLIVADRDSTGSSNPVERALIWRQLAPAPTPCGDCTTVCKPACSTQHFASLVLGNS